MNAADAGQKPNIVFIVLDDLGWGDFGCYGQKLIQTPNVDQIASEGTRFTDCYAGAAVCAPSRAVLMTGLHGGHAPIRANAGTIPMLPGDRTVAQVLKEAGYNTGGFGKWGLGDAGSASVPSKKGFDEFFGYLHQVHAHSYYPDFLWNNDTKLPLHGEYSADLIAERSFAFLRKQKPGKPFFLYSCSTLPHAKFEVPDLEPYTNKPWTTGQKTYAAMITRADRHIGTITRILRETGQDRNTVLFVTSDNGAHSGEGKGFELFNSNGVLRGEKTQLYEGGIRVPMIVRWPDRVRAKAVSGLPWSFCDFLPTAAEIAGARTPSGLDGISVVPELLGKPQKQHEYLYWEHHGFNAKAGDIQVNAMKQAARMGNWKGIRQKPGAPLEIYNLREDITERTDVAERNPAVARKLEEILASAHTKPRPHNTGSMKWVE
jgi:arylsulfatase A-like enzyme